MFACTDDVGVLHDALTHWFNQAQAVRWSEVVTPSVASWAGITARLRSLGVPLSGARREVARFPWDGLVRSLDRHTRLRELNAPRVIVENEIRLVGDLVESLDARAWKPVRRFTQLGRLPLGDGEGDVVDLAGFAYHAVDLMAGPHLDDRGNGDLGADDAFAFLDDYWYIHGQPHLGGDTAWSVAPEKLVPPSMGPSLPFLAIPRASKSLSVRMWRRCAASLPFGERGGAMRRAQLKDGATAISLVWVRTEEVPDPFGFART